MTGFVQADLATILPDRFEATTTTRSRWPTSVALITYAGFEARATFTHLLPRLQRCHE